MLERRSLASSFTLTTTPRARTENNSLGGWGGGGVCCLVEEQSSCKRIRSIYLVWLWMLTETTVDSTGLHSSPCVFEWTLTQSVHLYFPQAELDLLVDYKRPAR